jgi:hypothetical protein
MNKQLLLLQPHGGFNLVSGYTFTGQGLAAGFVAGASTFPTLAHVL